MSDVGPDLSHHQASADFAAVAAAGCRFAVHKAFESSADPAFADRWPRMRAAGLARGAYAFLILNGDGRSQAEGFLRTVDAAGGFAEGDLHPICDVEWGPPGHPNNHATKASTIACVAGWAKRISEEGLEAAMYGRRTLLDLQIRQQDLPGIRHLWVPRYNSVLGSPAIDGWQDALVRAWQYTNGVLNFTAMPKSIPGIGACDVSTLVGDLAAWQIGGGDEMTDEEKKALAEALKLAREANEFRAGINLRRLKPKEPEPAEDGARRNGWRFADEAFGRPAAGGSSGSADLQKHAADPAAHHGHEAVEHKAP